MPPRPYLTFAPTDYAFGIGPLRIRVTAIGGRARRDGDIWVTVEGSEYSWNGQVIGPRQADIRASALNRAGVALQ